jgi:hypothetical protein
MSERRRNVTADPDSPRFRLYRLTECRQCGGTGKVPAEGRTVQRCGLCRGEGRDREIVAEAPDEASVGVALIQCAGEGEWLDEAGDPMPFGLFDAEQRKWLVLPWLASARNVRDAAKLLGSQKRKTGGSHGS